MSDYNIQDWMLPGNFVQLAETQPSELLPISSMELKPNKHYKVREIVIRPRPDKDPIIGFYVGLRLEGVRIGKVSSDDIPFDIRRFRKAKAIELTVDEISQKLGFKVKIV